MTYDISTIIQVVAATISIICLYSVRQHFKTYVIGINSETELPSATTYYIPIQELHDFIRFIAIVRCDADVTNATPEELAKYWNDYCLQKNRDTSLYPKQEEQVL